MEESVRGGAELGADVLARVGEAVVGGQDQLRLVLAAVLAGGNVLLEDLPGTGKTLVARSFAQALGLAQRRVQLTPDLLPADVTGSFVYDQRASVFEFRPGPVFTNLLLADEINRTPPRTQAALPEAMQERQVTVEDTTYPLAPPFHDVRPPTTRAVARATEVRVPTARSSGALVVVLRPLLDPRTTTLLADLRRRGSSVVAVDVLPSAAVPGGDLGSAADLARRLWLLERQALTARLAELGVPVVAWSGVGSLDAVLVPLARLAGAPRSVRS